MACDHCGAEFGSRREEIEHVLSEHGDDISSHRADELKRERNRLDEESNGGGLPVSRRAIAAGVMLLAVVGGGYALMNTGAVSFTSSGGGTDTPTGNVGAQVGPPGSAHDHAGFSVVVDGEPIRFSKPRYQLQADRVHFEGGDGSTIHKHATGVTVEYALETLGLDVNATCLTVHGDQYCEPEGEVEVTVNGEPAEDGGDHVIRDGETIRIAYTEG